MVSVLRPETGSGRRVGAGEARPRPPPVILHFSCMPNASFLRDLMLCIPLIIVFFYIYLQTHRVRQFEW